MFDDDKNIIERRMGLHCIYLLGRVELKSNLEQNVCLKKVFLVKKKLNWALRQFSEFCYQFQSKIEFNKQNQNRLSIYKFKTRKEKQTK